MQIAEIPVAFSFIESRVDNKMCILRELFSAFLLISLLRIDDHEGKGESVVGRYFERPSLSPSPLCERFAFKT